MAITSTFSPTAGAGILYKSDAATGWQVCHDAADATGTYASLINYDYTLSGTSYISRDFLPFDISTIPSGSTIDSAFIRLVANGTASENESTETIDIVANTQASNTSLANADYDQLGTTVMGSLAVASYNSTNLATNDMALNATGLAVITAALGGTAKFAIRFERDRANSAPGDTKDNRVYYTQASTLLSVTYTPPSSGFLALL